MPVSSASAVAESVSKIAGLVQVASGFRVFGLSYGR